MAKCPLCGLDAEMKGIDIHDSEYFCSCQNCGKYIIDSDFVNFFNIESEGHLLHLLSGYIREMNELGKLDFLITYKNYNDIITSPLIPRTIGAKLEKLLLYYYRKTQYFGEIKYINLETNYAICYAKNPDEAESLFDQLEKLDFIEKINLSGNFTLTLLGIQQAEQNEKEHNTSTTCFVAMWFNNELDIVYINAIKPAIEDKTFYDYVAVQVGKKEHNNDITDEIIAGIRECHFMIADMTGYRGGVYFEAGFAKGLGKPVIFTCRKDWFEGNDGKDGNPVKEKVHFDINHQNIIVWKTEEELKKRIIDRIRATIF